MKSHEFPNEVPVVSAEQAEKISRATAFLDLEEETLVSEEQASERLDPSFWQKNGDGLRRITLAASLAVGSLVAAGCDKKVSSDEMNGK